MENLFRKLMIFSFIALIFLQKIVIAQQASNARLLHGYDMGFDVGFGLLSPFGDIKQYRIVPAYKYKTELGAGGFIGLHKPISQIINIGGQLGFGHMIGSNREQSIYFKTGILSFNGVVDINVVQLMRSGMPNADRKFSAYLFSGLGMIQYVSNSYALRSDAILSSAQEVNSNTLGVPIGGKVKFHMNDKIDLGFELATNITFTDNLDNAIVQGSTNDLYTYSMFSLTYKYVKSNNHKLKEKERLLAEATLQNAALKAEINQKDFEMQRIQEQLNEAQREVERAKIEIEEFKEELAENEVRHSNEVVFQVQILATKHKINLNRPTFISIRNVTKVIFVDELYKYMVGQYQTIHEAQVAKKRLKNMGFADAFLVASQNGNRLNIQEAVKISSKLLTNK